MDNCCVHWVEAGMDRVTMKLKRSTLKGQLRGQ